MDEKFDINCVYSLFDDNNMQKNTNHIIHQVTEETPRAYALLTEA